MKRQLGKCRCKAPQRGEKGKSKGYSEGTCLPVPFRFKGEAGILEDFLDLRVWRPDLFELIKA
eukprot:4642991-Karenia_brevis.AAC.1